MKIFDFRYSPPRYNIILRSFLFFREIAESGPCLSIIRLKVQLDKW